MQMQREYMDEIGFKPYFRWLALYTVLETRDIEALKDCFKPYFRWLALYTLIF